MRSQRGLWKISIWLLALTGWFNLATDAAIAQRASSPKNGKKVESTRNAASEDTALGESLDDRQALAAQKFDTGQDFHAQGKLTDAIKLYDEALQLDDQLFAVHYQRGIALLSLNRFEDAAASLTRCVELQDDFARGFAMLGEAQLRCKKPVEAEKAFLRATELDSSLGFARFGAAQLMLARKAPTEALTLLKELAQTPPEDPAFYAVYAEAQRLSGDAPGAFQTLSDGLTRLGNQPQLLRGRAIAYLNQKNYPKALADFQAVYTIEPDPVLARDILDLYRAAKLTEDGIQFAQVAFKQHSNNGPLRAAFGELLMEGNRTTEAIEQYLELTKQEPKNATWWVKLGDAAQGTDPAVALDAYQKALSINPRSPDAQAGVASGLLKSQRFQEAASSFRTILNQDPESYAAHAGLATALFKLEQFPTAAQHFLWMIQKRPDVPVTYYFLGICFDRLGDYAQALKAYELFVERANPQTNQLEIEKVNLRLPSLKRQAEKQGTRK